jgi:hypothetical protein
MAWGLRSGSRRAVAITWMVAAGALAALPVPAAAATYPEVIVPGLSINGIS